MNHGEIFYWSLEKLASNLEWNIQDLNVERAKENFTIWILWDKETAKIKYLSIHFIRNSYLTFY